MLFLLFGGIVGVVAGLVGLQFWIVGVMFVVVLYLVVFAFGVVVVVGLFFGLYLVNRAASLCLIDVLRYE